jgi:hypothetical protein
VHCVLLLQLSSSCLVSSAARFHACSSALCTCLGFCLSPCNTAGGTAAWNLFGVDPCMPYAAHKVQLTCQAELVM